MIKIRTILINIPDNCVVVSNELGHRFRCKHFRQQFLLSYFYIYKTVSLLSLNERKRSVLFVVEEGIKCIIIATCGMLSFVFFSMTSYFDELHAKRRKHDASEKMIVNMYTALMLLFKATHSTAGYILRSSRA